jgi:hypothetical protein
MAEYCGTAALANAVVISWSCFPLSSAFEGPNASLRHHAFENHRHLQIPQSSIEVMYVRPMGGM